MNKTCTVDYTISTPRLKSGGNKPAAYNRLLGDFTYEYDEEILQEFGLYKISFCFFILWNHSKTDGAFNKKIWMKREISIKPDSYVNLSDPIFEKKFFDNDPLEEVRRNLSFFEGHNLQCSYMLIKDLHNQYAINEQSKVALQVVIDRQTGQMKKMPISYECMKELLIKNSNGKFKINKPLNYFETDFERLLAVESKETGALFPGDCDMLLYDQDNRCNYILEFKKCTASGNIPVQEQSFLNYIKKDRSKYLRLNIMRKYFENVESRRIPLLNIFYPTTSEKILKIEEITLDMKPGKSIFIPLKAQPEANQYEIINQIMRHF